jgi:DNA ligase D-like protein (predicted 3'-phosphoesterase)
MPKNNRLKAYRKKRDLHKSPEPSGRGSRGSGKPRFVVQKHQAKRLHYDFRLEVDGALKSWAIPKGPSTDPRDKRLAVQTEDHPLDYGGFEGVIPEGEYGAGTVLVWDAGEYRNLKEESDHPMSMGDAVDRGHVTVWLEGEKLRGGYALTRFRKGKKDHWLLVKMDDEESDARRNSTSTQPESVVSGRTIEEVRKQEE